MSFTLHRLQLCDSLLLFAEINEQRIHKGLISTFIEGGFKVKLFFCFCFFLDSIYSSMQQTLPLHMSESVNNTVQSWPTTYKWQMKGLQLFQENISKLWVIHSESSTVKFIETVPLILFMGYFLHFTFLFIVLNTSDLVNSLCAVPYMWVESHHHLCLQEDTWP